MRKEEVSTLRGGSRQKTEFFQEKLKNEGVSALQCCGEGLEKKRVFAPHCPGDKLGKNRSSSFGNHRKNGFAEEVSRGNGLLSFEGTSKKEGGCNDVGEILTKNGLLVGMSQEKGGFQCCGYNLKKQSGLGFRGIPSRKWVLALSAKSQQENGPCCRKHLKEKGVSMLRRKSQRETGHFREDQVKRGVNVSTMRRESQDGKLVSLLHFRRGELRKKTSSLFTKPQEHAGSWKKPLR